MPETRTSSFIQVPTQSIQNQQPIISTSQHNYRLIGQYHKTYLLIEQDDGLFIIDQHAAHERILYEEFATRFDTVPSVHLLFPIMVPISKEALDLLMPYLTLFEKHKIIMEPFGNEQLIIQSIPVHLKETSLDTLIHKTVAWISEYKNLEQEELFSTLHHHMRAQMACSAAVKAGYELTQATMEQLLQDLFKAPNRLSCPHGRPTGWLLPLYEIEKKFKRK
jgi:DNA mismatch repair protein MutL